jgi:hypothetical protein
MVKEFLAPTTVSPFQMDVISCGLPLSPAKITTVFSSLLSIICPTFLSIYFTIEGKYFVSPRLSGVQIANLVSSGVGENGPWHKDIE